MTSFYTQLLQRIVDFIWGTDLKRLPSWKQSLFNSLRIGYLTLRDLFEGQLNLRAMSLVYTTLLSIVPLLAVSVSVLKGFGAQGQIEAYLPTLLEPLGERGKEISDTIIKFVEGIHSGILGSLGLALLLYTVVSLMQKIEAAFNYTWHVNEERSFARRFSDYLSVILIGPVLIFTALSLTASVTNSALYQAAMSYPVFSVLVGVFKLFIPYLLIITAFTLIYIFIPNTRVKFTSALVGAIVAGLLWQTVGWLFASYVSNANYTAIYAAFAALFFFMIWLYISWSILLIGGSIAFYFQNPEYHSLSRRNIFLSNRMKEKAVLILMTKIAECYYKKQPPMGLGELASFLNVASEALSPVMDNLVKCGLVIRTDSEPAGYLPGQAPDVLQVADILNAVRSAEEDDIIKLKRLPHIRDVDAYFDRYQAAVVDTLSGVTLKDLVTPADQDETKQLTG